MRIGVAGYGMVGKAVVNGFKQCDPLIFDPNISPQMTIEHICNLNPQLFFVCVPTPTKNSQFDNTILFETLSKINKHYNGIVVIKSTVPPNYLSDAYNRYTNVKLVYNPEFLSDRTANEDFIKPPMVVIGCQDKDVANTVKSAYLEHSSVICDDNNIHITDLKTASILKYGFNTYYSTKIIFMNELYRILNKSNANISWDDFKKIYGANEWIGTRHLDVPGHDGYFGYGGKCFPKDTKAFVEYAESINQPFELLKEVVRLNEKYRNE